VRAGKSSFREAPVKASTAGEDRLGFQNHPVAAAERPIVNDVVLVSGPLPQIVSYYFNQSGITCSPQNSTIDHFAKKLGKDRDDIEAQHFRESKI
jgi:hypothetical protein